MGSLKLFLVSCDQLDRRAVSELTGEERERLVGYMVQPAIPKTITADIPTINEWELPWYDPRYQNKQYYEYSAIAHCYKNPGLIRDVSHVGLLHYDVFFTRDSVRQLQDRTAQKPETIFYITHRKGDLCLSPRQLRQICGFLNQRLPIKVDPDHILVNGWISEALSVTPVEIFREFGRFLTTYHSEIEEILLSLNRWSRLTHYHHRVCGLVERMWGFYLVSLGLPLEQMNVIHDWDYYQHAHLDPVNRQVKR